MEDSTLSNSFSLQVDDSVVRYLTEASKWGKFLSIMGFVFISIIVICGLVFMFTGGLVSSSTVNTDLQSLDLPGSFGVLFGLYFFVIALIYFFPCLFLYRFSTKMQVAIRTNDQVMLNRSFENLKSLLKYMGIIMIIILSVWVLTILFNAILGSLF